MIRVFVVDHSDDACQATSALLTASEGVMCAGVSTALADAPRVVAENEADVVLIEPAVEGGAGLELIARIHRTTDGMTRVVAYSALDELDAYEDALAAGASGFLMKTHSPRVLAHVVRHVADGGSFLSPRVTQHIMKQMGADALAIDPQEHGLTPEEQRVLELHGLRRTPTQIAEDLAISLDAVEAHLVSLQHKTGAENEWELKCRVCQFADCVIVPGEGEEEQAGVDPSGRGMEPCKHRNLSSG